MADEIGCTQTAQTTPNQSNPGDVPLPFPVPPSSPNTLIAATQRILYSPSALRVILRISIWGTESDFGQRTFSYCDLWECFYKLDAEYFINVNVEFLKGLFAGFKSFSLQQNNIGDTHQKDVIHIAKKWRFLISCLPPKTERSYNQTTLTLFALNILDHILIYIKVPLCLSKLQLFYLKWIIFDLWV